LTAIFGSEVSFLAFETDITAHGAGLPTADFTAMQLYCLFFSQQFRSSEILAIVNK